MSSPTRILSAERALLGLVLTNNTAYHEACNQLTTEHFAQESHQIIFYAIKDLYGKNKPIDHFILTEHLKHLELLDECGGKQYIEAINNEAGEASNLAFYIHQLIQQDYSTSLLHWSDELKELAFTNYEDGKEQLSEVIRELCKLENTNAPALNRRVGDILKGAVKEQKKNQQALITFGFDKLDNLIQGVTPGECVIVGARPGMGKSAFLLSVALHNAKKNIACAYFSFEMGKTRITERIIASELSIQRDAFIHDQFSAEQHQQVSKFKNRLEEMPLYIVDTPVQSTEPLIQSIRRLVVYRKVQVVFLDYLQMLQLKNESRQSRDHEISQISGKLKSLARELDIVLVTSSQLNRGAAYRRGKGFQPVLTDLRESGAIEQDADKVLFINRPEYYGDYTDHEGRSTAGYAEITVAKNRMGKLGKVPLHFDGACTRFSNWNEKKNALKQFLDIGSRTDEFEDE